MNSFLNKKVIIAILLFLNSTCLLAQPLNGTYTIGNSADFDSISHAVDTLVKYGVSGPVTFHIQAGTYEEQLIIPEITGVNQANNIIFSSLSGNKEDVIIQVGSGGGAPDDFVLKFEGADYITFKNVTIKTLTSYDGNVILFTNSCNYNRFEDNTIQAPYVDVPYGSVLVSAIDTSDNYNEFINNEFINGSQAFLFSGSYEWNGEGYTVTACDTANIISENTFTNLAAGMLQSQYSYNFVISSNTFNFYGGGEMYDPINVIGCESSTGTQITNNKIIVDSYGAGIIMESCGASGNEGLIANNFIYFAGRGNSTGIGCYYSSYQNIYYNTVRIESEYGGGGEVMYAESRGGMYGLEMDGGENNVIVNNNVYIKEGDPISIDNSGSISLSDHNNFYNPYGDIGYWDGYYAGSLEDWQYYSGMDNNSVSTDPLFVEEMDYHTFNNLLNAKGAPVAGITTDLDGETRDATNPDIGADEFSPPENDAGITALVSPTRVLTGLNEVKVRLTNFGYNVLDTVVINWELDGIAQIPVSWQGALNSGDSTEVSLENINFSDKNYDFKIWTSSPNGTADDNSDNDTLYQTIYPPLSGVYKIGGTGPDFPDFNSAVNRLKKAGIRGSTTFEIRDGSYNESIIIPAIVGTDADNTIVFESESTDSTQVILEGNSDDPVIAMDSTNFITFRRLTIRNQNSNYADIISLNNGASNNIFQNNIIENTSYSSGSLISSESGFNNNNEFTDNIFNYGRYALSLGGAYNQYQSGNVISNNYFVNQGRSAIQLNYQSSLNITGNTIESSDYVSFDGIDINTCNNGLTILNNKIYVTHGGSGISLSACKGSLQNRGLIANNFIYVGGASLSHGLYIYNSEYLNIYYNNINITSTYASSSTSALYIYSGAYLKLANNIFANNGGYYSVYCTSSPNIQSSDYNDLYSSGSNIAYWDEDMQTLTQWQNKTGQDANSFAVDPIYVSDTNLHVRQALLYKSGLAISGINQDIDGENRNLTNPCIGADEFIPLQTDAGITSVSNPVIPFESENQNIVVILKNFGLDTLKAVDINWEFNGVAQTGNSWNGKLATGDTVNVPLGNVNFIANAPNSLKVWVNNPNGVPDTDNLNDTISVQLYKALGGVYTIGGTNPEFTTISEAVDVLLNGGVIQPVTFNIREGSYKEAIFLEDFPGSSDVNTVTFQSEDLDSTKVSIENETDTSSFIIKLSGVSNIYFNSLTITNTDNLYLNLLEIKNNSSHITIENSILHNPGDNSGSCIYSDAAENNYITINNNNIYEGNYGLNMLGNSSSRTKYNIVKNNTFSGQRNYSVYFSYHESPKVENNNFISLFANNPFAACYLYYCSDSITISKNKIDLQGSSYGIDLYRCTISGYKSRVSNNFISVGQNNSYGIYLYYCENISIYFNNINVNGGTYSRGIYFYYGSSNLLYNNNIVNSGQGYAIYLNNTSSLLSSNYNNFYTNGANLAYCSGYRQTLEDWQSYTNKDGSSLSVDPLYISTSDLHVREYRLKRAGSAVTGITDDIDNQPRNSEKPDIGADEFELLQNDIGITEIQNFGEGEKTVHATLMNFGSETLTSASINWSVNGAIQPAVSWSETLQSEATSEVALGTYNFQNGQLYIIKAWTANPNSLTDENPANDTLEITGQYTSLSGIYTIGGSTPDYETFNDAISDLINKGIADSVIFDVRAGDYNEQVAIPEISGADKSDAIVFRSESGTNTDVTLYYNESTSSLNYAIQLDGASNITFKDMGIKAENSSYSRVVEIKNNCQNIVFRNTLIQGYNTSSYSTNYVLIYSSASSNLHFINNKFMYGSYAIYTYQSSDTQGSKITGNQFLDQYRSALYLYHEESPEISNNTVKTISTYGGYSGIFLRYCSSYVINNNIVNIENNGIGLNIYDCSSSELSRGLIYNNLIALGSDYTAEGIQLQNSSYIDIYYNNLEINSTHTNYGRCIDASNVQSITFKNNIFYNAGGGYTVYLSVATDIEADYNNYYTEGANFAYFSNSIQSFDEWKFISGQDANSFSINPQYTAPDDLHVNATALFHAGINIPSITHDIDGDTRSQHPCIGADEFSIGTSDAGVTGIEMFKNGLQDIVAVVKNYGADTLKSVEVKCEIDDADFATINWAGELLTNDTVHVNMGSSSFNSGQSYKIKTWTSLPNGTTDNNTENDTLITNIYPAMSGVYTVGGTSPDYNTFYDAVEALKTYGVADTVVFKVRAGTYNEQITIPEIEGATDRNSIVFTSESNINTDVELIYNSTSNSQNYTILLDGTKGASFENMTIKALGTSYSRIVELRGLDENISFTNNIFQGYNNPSASTTYSVSIASFNGRNKNIFIENNTFNYSSYGIYIENDIVLDNIIVNNNTFNNQSYYGIYLEQFTGVEISENQISINSQLSDSYACALFGCENLLTFTKNKISVSNTGKGIYINNYNGSETQKGLIANNFIFVEGASNSVGIYLSSASYFDLYYNSVNIENTNTSGKAAYLYYSKNINIKNNNLVNAGGAYTLYIQYPQGDIESDYNNLYTTGEILAYWNTNISNLPQWKSTTNNDLNSVSIDPMYISQDDLHVKEILLDGSGTPVPDILDDIDGELRDNSTPDIGADEFEPLGSDAGIVALSSPVSPFNHGENEVSVILRNFGSDTLKNVDINWEFNGVTGTVHNWTGTLTPAQSTQVVLGNKNFVADTVNYIKAWTSNPGGAADLNNANDTLMVDSLFTALHGEYTLGGTDPDFENFTQAVEHLSLRGITGPVQFNVRSGVYLEQVSIPEIDGATERNDVVFISESGDSTAVTLQYNSTNSNYNYVLKLDGADGTSFKDITIKSLNSSYGRVIELANGANYNTFENTRLEGISSTSTSTALSVIYSYNTTDNYNLVKNNYIKDGSYGAYLRGMNNLSAYGKGNELINNIFENQYYYGVYSYFQNSFVCDANTITNQTASNSYTACYISYNADSLSIQNNRLDLQVCSNAIYLRQYQGETVNKSFIANNFITLRGSNEARGIYSYYSENINLCYNSINILNTNASSRAIYIYRGRGNALHNNILVNTGGGYAIYVYYTSGVSLMDCNNYFVTGDYIGYWNGNRATLADWKTYSNKDANSISIDPQFVSLTDLHVKEVSLNNTAIPIYGITKDIDGETRNTETPDIGADEFTPVIENEAGVTAIAELDAPFASGAKEVKLVIRNFGTNTIDSLNINWECNGVQQPEYIWKGTLPSAAEDTITIGSYNFDINTAYSIKAWSELPNGQADSNTSNDTAFLNNIYAALNGTYSIAASGADFSSFSEATSNLKLGGALGHVTFLVADGTYNEQFSLTEVPGSSASATVTFQSANMDSTKVNLSFQPTSSDNYVIKIDGADYITFQGLTIQSITSSYNRVIEIANGANYISFKNNIIKAEQAYNNYEVILSETSVDNYMEVYGNVISNGNVGLYLRGSDNNYEYNAIIKNNVFQNQYSKAIALQYQRNTQVTGNEITTTSSNTGFRAIEFLYGSITNEISQNKIQIANGGYGLYLYYVSAYSYNRALIANNFIQVGGNSTAYGIYNRSCSYQDFYHNSIHINSSHASNGMCFYSYYSSGSNVYNNIFYNSGNGYAYYTYRTSDIINTDYNDIFSSGTNFAYWGQAAGNLSELQSLSGKDQNSVSVNPQFISSTDLHVQEAQLNNTGTPLSNVNIDIDGEPRSESTPDIGADEFDVNNENDAGILALTSPEVPFAEGNNDVYLVVKNYGTDTLEALTIQWEVNGVTQPAYNWAGELLQSGTDTINVGSYHFLMLKNHNIKAWTELPNGTDDNNTFNDTLFVNNLHTAIGGELTIGGSNPDFENFTEAINRLKNAGVNAPITFYVRNGNYTEQLLIEQYPGVDSLNNITFLSESGDSTQVALSYSASSSDNYVINMDGASHYTFKGITIKNTNSTNGRVIVLKNGAGNNKFISNIIQGSTNSTIDNDRALVYSSNTVEDSILFKNNLFRYGCYGLYLSGDAGEYEKNTIAESNTFLDQRKSAIYAFYQDNLSVNKNKIITTHDVTEYYGYYISYFKQLNLHKNSFDIKNSSIGIYLNHAESTEINPSFITNNFIHMGGTSHVVDGIYYTNSQYVNIYNNSVHVSNSLANSRCININSGSDLSLLNNILANTGGGYALYLANTGVIESSDYNDLYTSGANLAYLTTNNYTNLASWQSVSGFDTNSMSADPDFNSNSDLHVNEVLLNAKALYTPLVTDDIDGQPRNTSTPDIGADEFNPPAGNDAGVIAIIGPDIPFDVGEHNIQAVIRNFGEDTLNTVTVAWDINTQNQLPYEWSGLILPGNTDTVNLGVCNFEFTPAYNIKAWTENPNQVQDSIPANDTTVLADLYTGLTGIFTIGGDAPHFVNFTQAVGRLNKGGVVGPVIFNVRNRVYHNQIQINEIHGSSPENYIIFQSESGDSSAVTLTYEGSYSNNYTLKLNGTDNITFKGITIQSTGSRYSVVVEIGNGCENIKFLNNRIIGTFDYSESEELIVSGALGNNFEAGNNYFLNGIIGLSISGKSSDLSENFIIQNNKFENQIQKGIYCRYANAPQIKGNTINTITSNNLYSACNLYNCDSNTVISKNKIYIKNSGYGIEISNCEGISSHRAEISNNFITVGGNHNSYGISLNNSNAYNIYNNNINNKCTNTGIGGALYINQGANHIIKNNNLINASGGYTVYSTVSSISISDYNNLFTTGGNLAYWGQDIANMATWRSITGLDNNSITVNPQYISETDLHVRDILLNNAGTPLQSIVDDIDNEVRHETHPDIGADEFIPPPGHDAGIYSFVAPQYPFSVGDNSVLIELRNFGSDTLKSATIDWEVNNTLQTAYNWAGEILPGKSDTITIGNYNFEKVDEYNFKIWASMPNGVEDTVNYNDTLFIENIYPALNGTYVIGGSDPDFSGFNEASKALKYGGVTGPVTFNVMAATYNEQVTIGEIQGASQTNTITFQSEKGDSTSVILSYAATVSNNYTLQLNGADFITIKKITIRSTNKDYGIAVDLKNGANNNQFLNNKIIGVNPDYLYGYGHSVIFSTNTIDNNNRFENNSIERGTYGMHISGSYNDNLEQGLAIKNNTFTNQYFGAVKLTYCDAVVISGNTITSEVSRDSYIGISLDENRNGFIITENKLNLKNAKGILLNKYTSLSNYGLIANNFIHCYGDKYSCGITLLYSEYTNMYFNTISVSATGSRCISITDGKSNNLKNNILANLAGGYTYYITNASVINNSDYNDLFTTGSNIAFCEQTISDIEAWKTTTGKDANSLSVDPLFIADGDVHILELSLKNAATPIAGITHDIDGEIRNVSNPDIGADEFFMPTNDAGIIAINAPEMPFNPGANNIKVVLKNFGANNIENVDINWIVNADVQPIYEWTGVLQPGKTDTVIVGQYNFEDAIKYNISAWTEDPNGETDTLEYNDHCNRDNIYTTLNGTYTIAGAGHDFKDFTEAVKALNNGGITGPVIFNVRDSLFKEEIAINQIAGSSPTNTIEFTSETSYNSQVILSNSSDLNNYTLLINEADYITFTGITIETKNRNSAVAVKLTNHADNISFKTCKINGVQTTSYHYAHAAIHISNSENILFDHNEINYGSMGIFVQGLNDENLLNGIQITNNTLTNQNYKAINLNYANAPVISENTIIANENSVTLSALDLANCHNNMIITRNQINITSRAYGIKLSGCTGTSLNKGLVANNFIHIGGTGNAYGLRISNNTFVNFYYNTIHISGTNQTKAMPLYAETNNYCEIKNNIFCNSGGGYAINYYTISGYGTIDYNNLYTVGNSLAYYNTNVANFDDWKTVSGVDEHSVSVDPLFLSEDDYHIMQTALDSAASPAGDITSDIEGDTRDGSFPDIGADEFEPNPNDIGIAEILTKSGCQLTTQEIVKVIIQNYGINPQTGFDIAYSVNNKDTVIENVGSLIVLPGETVEYEFSTPGDMSKIGNMWLKAFTLLTGDNNQGNNALGKTISNIFKFNAIVKGKSSICYGSQTNLEVENGTTYLWYDGTTKSSINVSPLIATDYTVTTTNSYGCTDIDTFRVEVLPLPEKPVISANGPVNFCYGENVLLSSDITESIKWNTGSILPYINVNHQGAFYITHTGDNGCSINSDPIHVTEEEKPAIKIPEITRICVGDLVDLEVVNAASQLWSTSEIDHIITVAPFVTTTYYVDATTPLGCTFRDSITIEVLPPDLVPGTVGNMLPENGRMDLSLPLPISWGPAVNASYYDIYIWEENGPVPLRPKISNYRGIRKVLSEGSLPYGKTYKWKVIAKTGCKETEGPIQTFNLRKLPDIIVTDVETPLKAYSGQAIDVNWKIKNIGEGNTAFQHWDDVVYLSTDSFIGVDYYFGRLANMTYLEPGQEYSKTATFTIPEHIVGNYYAYLHTNPSPFPTGLLETNTKNNYKMQEEPMWVRLNPPPDLQVTSIVPPKHAFSEQTYELSWTITNKGEGDALAGEITDRVFMERADGKKERYPLGTFRHSGTLEAGEESIQRGNITFPIGVFGNFFIFVETDITNRVIEHAYDGNNTSQSDTVDIILTPPPDLIISKITIPDSVNNRDTLEVTWTGRNIGAAASDIAVRGWNDKVTITTAKDIETHSDSTYTYYFYNNKKGLPAGYSYTRTEKIKVPKFVYEGDYYVFVTVDESKAVFEYNADTNNTSRSDTTVNIYIVPWADLQVKEINAPDTSSVGMEIPLSYIVKNYGTVKTDSSKWTDRIYISSDTTFSKGLTKLKEIDINKSLLSDSSYTITTTVTIPGVLKDGSKTYYIHVNTDDGNNVYELKLDENNHKCVPVFIKPSDLAITSTTTPETAYSSQPMRVSWEVTNTGDVTTPVNMWKDYAYFVKDTTSGYLIEIEMNKGIQLDPEENYINHNRFTLPDGISGEYFMKFITDRFNHNREKSLLNNRKVSDPIDVILTTPTDLIVSSNNAPADAISGQPVTVSYTVKNQGEGTTLASGWIDRIYLSNDYFPDKGDIALGSYHRSGKLDAGESYDVNLEVTPPVSANGNYILIIVTDDYIYNPPRGYEYEHHAENNNTSTSIITVTQPPPSDLVVESITVPPTATTGDIITIEWTDKNNGPNAANGIMKDMIYLSKDEYWDIDDILFAESQANISLNAGESMQRSHTAELKEAAVGEYYVIVKTDNRNNIYEVNDANNELASVDKINVLVNELKLYTHTTDTLFNDQELYYRIEIVDTLFDETLLVDLLGDTINGINEMYIKYNEMPTRVDYDYAFDNPFSGQQEVVVPSLQQGTYYLMVYGDSKTENFQEISLYAKILNFEIRRVKANKGGNTGTVTIEVQGSKFDETTEFSLFGNDTLITADKVEYIDPVKVFVTYDLRETELGYYSIIAEKPNGDSTALYNGFEIVEGTAEGLVTFVQYPSATRPNAVFFMTIQYANSGNVDLYIPQRVIKSLAGAPIAFNHKDLDKGYKQLNLEYRELNGPQDVLRPGAVGQILVFTKAVGGLTFVIYK